MEDMPKDAPPPWRDTEGLPEPPWRAARNPPSRAPLTRQAIVDAALRVLDAEGMDGLSMRRVGEELGTGAASIYWHVRNKEHLLQLIFERVTGQSELPVPDPAHWKEQLMALAFQMRAMLNSHRDGSGGGSSASSMTRSNTSWSSSSLFRTCQ